MLRCNMEEVLPQESGVVSFGSLEVDPEGYTARAGGEDLVLTFGEFLLLREFVTHPNQVLHRDRLAGLAREHPACSGTLSSPRSVDTHVARLRAKLRPAGCNWIKTMRFVGYRFAPPPGAACEAGAPIRHPSCSSYATIASS
jgi:DNA-binding response OmpR family regulator